MFWVLLGISLGYVLQDEVLVSQGLIGNQSWTIEKTGLNTYNYSIDETTNTARTPTSAFNTLRVMFGFGIPSENFPNGLAYFISTLNWLLLVILIITIYKLANPVSSA